MVMVTVVIMEVTMEVTMVTAIVMTMVAIQNQALAVALKRALIEFNIHKSSKVVSGIKSDTAFLFMKIVKWIFGIFLVK